MEDNIADKTSLVEWLFDGASFETSLCLLAILLASTAIIMNLIPKVPVLRKATFVPFLFLTPMILASAGIIPGSHPLYGPLQSVVLYMAIFFMVVAIDLGQILRSLQTRVVLLFFVGCVGTGLGAIVAHLIFTPILGAEPSAMVAACNAGAYVGGSMNWVAVADALDVPESLSAVAFPGMVIVYTIYLGALLALDYSPLRPVLERWIGVTSPEEPLEAGTAAFGQHTTIEPPTCDDYIKGFLAFSIVYLVSIVLEELVCRFVFIPLVIFLTSLTILLGAVAPRFAMFRATWMNRMSTFGEASLCFLVGIIGAQAMLTESLLQSPILLLVPLVVAIVHAFVLLPGTRLLKVDLTTASVISIALIGGAASAPAAAGALGKANLIPLGVLLGSLGYLVGTYLGVYLGVLLLAW